MTVINIKKGKSFHINKQYILQEIHVNVFQCQICTGMNEHNSKILNIIIIIYGFLRKILIIYGSSCPVHTKLGNHGILISYNLNMTSFQQLVCIFRSDL